MPTAVLTIDRPDASAAVSAVGPETHRDLPRTRTVIRMKGEKAELVIEADDVSSMRAAVNSYLECIKITEDIAKITKGTV